MLQPQAGAILRSFLSPISCWQGGQAQPSNRQDSSAVHLPRRNDCGKSNTSNCNCKSNSQHGNHRKSSHRHSVLATIPSNSNSVSQQQQVHCTANAALPPQCGRQSQCPREESAPQNWLLETWNLINCSSGKLGSSRAIDSVRPALSLFSTWWSRSSL